jgi:hypothetical protein
MYSINKVEHLYFDNSNFDKVIDCTYVLLCCGLHPQRLSSVLKNIKMLRPSNKVTFIFNNGFSNCNFSKTINHNLILMQLYIFNDSLRKRYNRILYLEDDFELKQEIDKYDIQQISTFIENENPEVYGLGNFSFPTMQGIFQKHQHVINNFLGCSHAMMYNQSYMKKYIEFIGKTKNPENLSIDFIPSFLDNIQAYRYYKPLVYQKFPATENQLNGWKNQMGNLKSKLAIFFVRLLNLNSNLEPGYSIVYALPFIVYICLAILIYFILYKIINNSKWKKSK